MNGTSSNKNRASRAPFAKWTRPGRRRSLAHQHHWWRGGRGNGDVERSRTFTKYIDNDGDDGRSRDLPVARSSQSAPFRMPFHVSAPLIWTTLYAIQLFISVIDEYLTNVSMFRALWRRHFLFPNRSVARRCHMRRLTWH